MSFSSLSFLSPDSIAALHDKRQSATKTHFMTLNAVHLIVPLSAIIAGYCRSNFFMSLPVRREVLPVAPRMESFDWTMQQSPAIAAILNYHVTVC